MNSFKSDLRLFLVSFVILFLELLLIRYVATEIRIFAYLSNILLLGIFVGSGLGMVVKKKLDITHSSVGLFFLSVLVTMKYIVRLPNVEFKLFSGLTELLAPLSEAHIWGQIDTYSLSGAGIGIVLALGLLALIAWVFVPLGQLLGNLLDHNRRPLWAYSINIVASLTGMWAFQALSLVQLSPVLGIILVQMLMLVLVKINLQRWIMLIFLGLTVVYMTPKVALQPYEGPTTFWSPYQKLTLSLINKQKEYQAEGWYLEVNNVGYMGLLNLDPKTTAKAVELAKDYNQSNPDDFSYLNQYDLPFQFVADPRSMLIVGAGGGNDAAAAVRQGVPEIVAVEIDPVIVKLGEEYHPEYPYRDESVRVVVDDGRAFMQRTDKKYDLVVMGLADSQTLGSSLTNLRLDNYLYTVESFERIREILTLRGVAVISFEVQRPWIGARIKNGLREAFGQEPVVFEVRSDGVFGWGGVFFVVGRDPQSVVSTLRDNQLLNDFVIGNKRDFSTQAKLLTDDWPYLYLDKPRLPLLYIFFSLAIISLLLIVNRQVRSNEKIQPTFMLLGAAFLLFEFQNISKSGLIFGNTWVTNLLIITSFLFLTLVANVLASRKLFGFKLAYMGLIISLLIQVLIPTRLFLVLDPGLRMLIAPLVLSLPILFSGMIFAKLFTQSQSKSRAFASNLIGLALGGTLEMFSFVLGMQALLYIVITLYGFSWLAYKRYDE